jgi:hypothetical protein
LGGSGFVGRDPCEGTAADAPAPIEDRCKFMVSVFTLEEPGMAGWDTVSFRANAHNVPNGRT